jgi:hypothetical protein
LGFRLLLGWLSVNGDGGIWTDNRADCTAGAPFSYQIGGVIAFGCQPFYIQREDVLGAGRNTKRASFAV